MSHPLTLRLTTLGSLSLFQRLQLRFLTLNSKSALRKWLKRAKPDSQLIIAHKGQIIYGWCTKGMSFSIFPPVHMVFVRKSQRGAKLGTRLLNASVTTFGPAPGVMWDLASAKFYTNALQFNLIQQAFLLKECPEYLPLHKGNAHLGVDYFSTPSP